MIAALSVYAIFKKIDKRILTFLLIFFFIYTLSYTPYILAWVQQGMPSIVDEMKASTPYIEYTREFLGLLICLMAVGYHYFFSRRVV